MDEIMTWEGKLGVGGYEDEMGKIFMGVWKKEITALKNDGERGAGEKRGKKIPGNEMKKLLIF